MATVSVGSPPAGAAPQPLVLTMADGGGQLRVRDADAPYALENPTTFSGTLDTGTGGTGAITAGSLATPPISFQTKVLNGALDAFVDATFTEVSSGTATGSVSPSGDVVLRTSLRVDLHIDVPAAGLAGDCSTSPVDIEMLSTSPYHRPTGTVTLADADLSIPAFIAGGGCPAEFVSPLNDLLAGSGHSLRLTLTGDVELPPVPGEASVTTLAVTPAGGADFGEEVTLRATVAPAPDAESTAVPTGSVSFLANGRSIGNVVLTGGVAELTTSRLGVGTYTLTAAYGGDSEYQGSISDGSVFTVAAVPAVDVDVPSRIIIGGQAEGFSVTVESSGLARPVSNVATQLTLTRQGGGFLFPGMVVVERRVTGDIWELVPLTASGSTALTGRIGPATGRHLAAPGLVADDLRIKAHPTGTSGSVTNAGYITVGLEVVEVDPSTGETIDSLTSTEGRTLLVGAQRIPTAVSFVDFFAPAVSPDVVRAGNTITLYSWFVEPSAAGPPLTGSVSLTIDGEPVTAWYPALGADADPVASVPVSPQGGGLPVMVIDLPPGTRTATHTIRVRYSGDPVHEPSTGEATFTVVPAVDRLYDCVDAEPSTPHRFRAQVSAFARLPSVAPRGTVATLRDLDVTFVVDRSIPTFSIFSDFIGDTPTEVDPPPTPPPFRGALDAVEFGFGEGAGTAASARYTGSVQEFSGDTQPDLTLSFDGESGTVPVTGVPGSTIAVALDRIYLEGRSQFSFTHRITCVPVDDPVDLGSIEVAGTVLTVDAPRPARVGDDVELRATVAPATATGQVEFRDGATVIAISAVEDGEATTSVRLPEGTHSLTARFRAGASAPSTTSDAVVVEVLPEHDCEAFAEEGSGAVVRLVYMSLLRRCPDAAGFAHWVGRLDGGTSSEVFARSIALTPEAVGVVVDDAYRVVLGRRSDAAGRTFWVDRLLSGSGRYDQLLADLAASGEFWSLAGSSDDGFVTRVYGRLLGRAPEAGGLAYWTDRLGAGVSRGTLVVSLANLDEPLGVVVGRSYGEILGRTPSSGERAGGIAFLRSTGDRSGLYAQLIGRPEFATRAQTFPNPS